MAVGLFGILEVHRSDVGCLPYHFDELATSESEVDVLVIFENIRVESIGIFQCLVNIAVEDSSSYA